VENNLIEVGRCVQAKGHVAGGWSGSMTGLAANAIVYALRNVGPSELLVDSVDLAFVTNAQATAATGIAFALHKVPITALANTGARATPPAPIRKRTADCKALNAANPPGDPGAGFDLLLQVQIAGVGALTGATITGGIAAFQDDPQGVFVPVAAGTGAASTLLFCGQYRWEPRNGIPLTLAADEGIVIVSRLAFPLSLAGQLYVGPDLRIS
jgi:hypothetical protein